MLLRVIAITFFALEIIILILLYNWDRLTMAKGMHKPKNLEKRQADYDKGTHISAKTKYHRPGSNKK
jgi:hypothetical protein